MSAPTEEQMSKELARAYRCICGLYSAIRQGRLPDETMLTYHSPIIGASRRFVIEEQHDGSDYFIGKPVSVLHEALKL